MLSGALCLLFAGIIYAENDIVIKVSPERIIDSFKSMMSSKFLRELADDFATKAAEHLLEQIKKNNGLSFPNKTNHDDSVDSADPMLGYEDQLPLGSRVADSALSESSKQALKLHYDLKKPSPQIMALLEDPSPDGDNLDQGLLSDKEDNKTEKPDAKSVKKINGKYFRNRKYHFIFL